MSVTALAVAYSFLQYFLFFLNKEKKSRNKKNCVFFFFNVAVICKQFRIFFLLNVLITFADDLLLLLLSLLSPLLLLVAYMTIISGRCQVNVAVVDSHDDREHGFFVVVTVVALFRLFYFRPQFSSIFKPVNFLKSSTGGNPEKVLENCYGISFCPYFLLIYWTHTVIFIFPFILLCDFVVFFFLFLKMGRVCNKVTKPANVYSVSVAYHRIRSFSFIREHVPLWRCKSV